MVFCQFNLLVSFLLFNNVCCFLTNKLIDAANASKSSSLRLKATKKFLNRRSVLIAGGVAAVFPNVASANDKDRSDGYSVQHTDREWAYLLSGPQYNILRQGGTERPNTSILEGEEREGTYRCAGCNTPLFVSSAKFHSGTGWPSFATALEGVEVEEVNPLLAGLTGAEIRCATCGGHLGDVFLDGKLFVNTPAFTSGKRFCVDGGALIFKPTDGGDDVFGDTPKKTQDIPGFLTPPKINARTT